MTLLYNVRIGFDNFVRKPLEFREDDLEQIKEVAKSIDESDKDFILLINGYGSGKSVSILSKAQAPFAFLMDGYNQLNEKIEDIEKFKKQVDSNEDRDYQNKHRYQIICGKGKWVGVRRYSEWENGELVWKAELSDDWIFEDRKPWLWDSDGKDMVKYENMKSERKKLKRGDFLEDCAKNGISNAIDKHKEDYDILKKYGKHMTDEILNGCILFTPKKLLPLLVSRDYKGTIAIDEGIRGCNPVDSTLKGYSNVMEKITGKKLSSKESRPKCDIPDFEIDSHEDKFVALFKLTRKAFLDVADSIGDKDFERMEYKESEEEYEYFHRGGLDIEDRTIEQLEKVYEKLNTGYKGKTPTIEEKTEQDIESIGRINEVMSVAKTLIDGYYQPVRHFRDNQNNFHKINLKIPASEFLNRVNFNNGNDVYILNASADEDYVNREITGELDVLGRDSKIGTTNPDELKTEQIHFGYGSKSSWNQSNLSSQRFKEDIVSVIDLLAKYEDTYSITVKKNRDNEEIAPMFDSESASNSDSEGSNDAKNTHNLITIGSERRNEVDIWKEIVDMYGEVLNFSQDQWEELKRYESWVGEDGKPKDGAVIGYKDPEKVFDNFEWEGEYDHNPLQRWWNQVIDKKNFEKSRRKRNQTTDHGRWIRLGLVPVIDSQKRAKTLGNHYDFVEYVLEQLPLTPVEKAKVIKKELPAKKFISECIPEDIPIHLYNNNNGNTWSIELQDFLLEELERKCWIPDGNHSHRKIKRDLYETVEDIIQEEIGNGLVTKRKLKRWVKNSEKFKYYPGNGRGNNSEVKPSEESNNPYIL